MPKPVFELRPMSQTEKALFAYLDDMLREGTESDAASVEAVSIGSDSSQSPSIEVSSAETSSPEKLITPLIKPVAVVEASITASVTATSDLSDSVMVAEEVAEFSEMELQEVIPVPVTADTGNAGWLDNGRPDWAQTRFNALIFKVAGLKLAVPLISLGLIHPIHRKFNALPHQSSWFLGMLRVPGGNTIKVIDTAMFVMPERYTSACRDDLKYVITLHGYDWGLACHEVDRAVALEPDTISWRTQRTKRPWMAGTVRDQMCAIIDSRGFHNVIAAVEPQKG